MQNKDYSLKTVIQKLRDEIVEAVNYADVEIAEEAEIRKFKFRRAIVILAASDEPNIELKVGRIQTKFFRVSILLAIKGASPQERLEGRLREGIFDFVRDVTQKIKLTTLDGILDTSPVSQVSNIEYLMEAGKRISGARLLWTGKRTEKINF